MQSCVRFAGNAQALRDWAGNTQLRELPPAGEQAFLQGSPGRVFDASNELGRRVLVSADSGACSTVAETADGAAVARDLEQALGQSGIAVTLKGEADDSAENALHHRDYVATKDTLRWHILVGTVRDKPGTAMLTVAP